VRRRPWDSTTSCVVFAAAVTLVVGAFVPRIPKTVDRLTVSNPSQFNVLVEVSDGDGTGWTTATIAGHDRVTVARDVIDQGNAWTFRFSVGSLPGGEVQVSRDDLASSGWRVEVPNAVIDHVHELGAAPAGGAG
jgi:hypothetical protein